MTEQTTLRRTEVRAILLRHPGACAQVAEVCGVTPSTVSQWIHGKTTSKRVAEAATGKALRLLEEEKGGGVKHVQ